MAAGVVRVPRVARANLCTLNPDHLAHAGVLALAGQRDELLGRIRSSLAAWSVPPESAWLYGSAARQRALAWIGDDPDDGALGALARQRHDTVLAIES